jgi:hypothetical protein
LLLLFTDLLLVVLEQFIIAIRKNEWILHLKSEVGLPRS